MSTRASRTEGRVVVKPAARRMWMTGGRRRESIRRSVDILGGIEWERLDGDVECMRCRSRSGVCYRSMLLRWASTKVDMIPQSSEVQQLARN